MLLGCFLMQVDAVITGIYRSAMAIGQDLLKDNPDLWSEMGDDAAAVARKICEVTVCNTAFTSSVEVSGMPILVLFGWVALCLGEVLV